MSGIEDLLVGSEMYGSTTVCTLLIGKAYNRGVRAHKILMEAIFRLKWNAFSQWLSKREDSNVNKVDIMQQTMASQLALGEERDVASPMKEMCDTITKLEPEFTRFE